VHSRLQQIAYEISSIVKQHVNIMDENGYIIASTDPKRIGDFHAGAKKIIDEHLDEFYVKKEDETSSTRAGLNLPININENIIGVVGITGEYEQVYNYGQIVRKMTEILVRESYAQNQERLDKKIENRFLEDWILGLQSPVMSALTVMAIGAGAMTVSHANDSYFWVVTNFGAMQPEQGYKTQTMVTLFEGLASMATVFILSLILH
jgi:carbohydrate diacid regulator